MYVIPCRSDSFTSGEFAVAVHGLMDTGIMTMKTADVLKETGNQTSEEYVNTGPIQS